MKWYTLIYNIRFQSNLKKLHIYFWYDKNENFIKNIYKLISKIYLIFCSNFSKNTIQFLKHCFFLDFLRFLSFYVSLFLYLFFISSKINVITLFFLENVMNHHIRFAKYNAFWINIRAHMYIRESERSL